MSLILSVWFFSDLFITMLTFHTTVLLYCFCKSKSTIEMHLICNVQLHSYYDSTIHCLAVITWVENLGLCIDWKLAFTVAKSEEILLSMDWWLEGWINHHGGSLWFWFFYFSWSFLVSVSLWISIYSSPYF